MDVIEKKSLSIYVMSWNIYFRQKEKIKRSFDENKTFAEGGIDLLNWYFLTKGPFK